MTKSNLLLIAMLSITFLVQGCQTQSSYVNGNSNLVNKDWQSRIQLYKTTEGEIISLLGKPSGYYHKVPNQNIKWLFYSSTETNTKKYHLPFVSEAQFSSQSKHKYHRVWLLSSQGILTEQLTTGKDPDLQGFIRSDSSEYPYCNSTKCRLKRESTKSSNQ